VSIVNERYLHVRGKEYEGVIAQMQGKWTPSPRDIADVEAALGPALAYRAQLSGPTSRWKRVHQRQATEAGHRSRVPGAELADRGVPSVKGGDCCSRHVRRRDARDHDVASERAEVILDHTRHDDHRARAGNGSVLHRG
jgi:hypothetical protein